MIRSQTLSTAVLLAAVTVAVNRQSQPPTSDPEIVTDRPDITESAIVVPKGSLQFESGLTWTSDDGQGGGSSSGKFCCGLAFRIKLS